MRRWAITIGIGVGIGTTAFGTDPEVEPTATDARRAIGGKTVDEWTRALRDRANRDHSRAAWMLAAFGPEAKAAVPELVEALDQGDLGVMNALASIGPDAAPAVPLLAKQFRKEECLHGKMGTFLYGRYSGPMYALVRIGAASVPELVMALEEPGGEYHPCAAEALGEIGPPAKAAVPVMIDILAMRDTSNHPDTAYASILYTLGQLGPDALPAVPILRQLLEKKGRLSWPAAAALYRLAPDGKELAKKRLESPIVGQVGWQMWDELEGRALLLGTMGQTSVEADAAIRSQLENVNDTLEAAEIEGFDRFPEWMIEQLARFGAGSRLAIPRLDKLRRHPYPWIRMWAGEALARIAKPES
jgi:HEAT repeat protein